MISARILDVEISCEFNKKEGIMMKNKLYPTVATIVLSVFLTKLLLLKFEHGQI
jgi:hypothetical protein